MDMMLLGTTLEFVGNACIAVSVLFVHQKMKKEHGIDSAFLKTLQHEQWLALSGLILMCLGFALEARALIVL